METEGRKVLQRAGLELAESIRFAYVNASSAEDKKRIVEIHNATAQFIQLSINYLESL